MKATDVMFLAPGKLDSINLDRLIMTRKSIMPIRSFSRACWAILDTAYGERGERMNDVESALQSMWIRKQSGVVGNTAIVDGVLLLHQTAIARREAGEVHVSLGGFDTKITRSRLKNVVGAQISRVMGKTAIETTDGLRYMEKHQWYRIK